MSFSLVADVARLLGKADMFTSPNLPGSGTVSGFIDIADKQIVRDVTWEFLEERIDTYTPTWYRGTPSSDWGYANGSNATFFIKHTPIADWDVDATITIGTGDYNNDVFLRQFDESADTWSTITNATISDWRLGKITINDGSEPPDNSRVYATYRNWIAGELPDSNLLKQASTYLVAMKIWQSPNADIVQLIDSYSLSGISISKGGQAAINMFIMKLYKTYYKETIRAINKGVYIGR